MQHAALKYSQIRNQRKIKTKLVVVFDYVTHHEKSPTGIRLEIITRKLDNISSVFMEANSIIEPLRRNTKYSETEN